MRVAVLHCAFVAWLSAATLAAAGTPADYEVVFALETHGDEPAWRIELTPDVHAHVRDGDLADLEVFNAAGIAVPFARLAEPRPAASVRDLPLALLALPAAAGPAGDDLRVIVERDADGRLRRIEADQRASPARPAARSWLADAGAIDCAIERIRFDWSGTEPGIVATFTLDYGSDLLHWRRAGHGNVLALEQDGARIERREIALSGAAAPYLRVTRVDPGADLPGLQATARCATREQAPARAWMQAEAVAPAAGTADAMRFEYRLPAALLLDQARIELAGGHALAAITLSTIDSSGAARVRAAQTAFHLQLDGQVLQNDTLAFTAPRSQRLLLESATPLSVPPRLTVGYRPESFVFLAEGEGPYRLAAGSARARHGAYPMDAALATLRARRGPDWSPPTATIGPMREAAGAAALQQPRETPWRQWLLWGVLGCAALAIVLFALRLLREREAG